ncbi:hypothetical protein FGO68_gene15783 [Halteria grandinella]|uniref:Uncharacterized protein n=1 Tax=Halteria grandinella TaxID=5974 RepID=A0A8J8T722_HALGN|nr:hypothetical protein FGO68_gene15783 [Halteria grandinella]
MAYILSLIFSVCWTLAFSRNLQEIQCNINAGEYFDATGQLFSTGTNLCDFTFCLMDEQCQSGYCSATETLCKPKPVEQILNQSCSTSQFLTKKEGDLFIAYGLAPNKCDGQSCTCNDECQSDFCDYQQTFCAPLSKPWPQKQICNSSFMLCDMNTVLQQYRDSTNRCNGVGCSCNFWCASGYCNMETLQCEDAFTLASCNSTDQMYCSYEYSDVPIYTGNRCLNTQCFCDSQCQSGYCNRENGVCELKQANQNSTSCNTSSTMYLCYENYTIEKTLQTLNRCENVQCLCDSQCQSGYCYNQKCNISKKFELTCNSSVNFLECENFNTIYSTNRCDGVYCVCNSDCQSNFCYYEFSELQGTCRNKSEVDPKCNNTVSECTGMVGSYYTFQTVVNRCLNVMCENHNDCQSGYCSLDTHQCTNHSLNISNELCNYTSNIEGLVNGTLQVIANTRNRCEGVDCQCDNQCTEGAYCNSQMHLCLKGKRANLKCNETQYLCTVDEETSVYQSTEETINRCEGAQCDCDNQCQSSYCLEDFRVCLIRNQTDEFKTCNNTVTYCREPSINRCLNTQCQCDNQCQSGYCDHYCKPNIMIACDARLDLCRFENGLKLPIEGTNKCYGAKCRCDSECNSGFCLFTNTNSSGLCAVEPVDCNLTSVQRCKKEGKLYEYSQNICDGVKCVWDGDCKSGYCNERGVCGSVKVVQSCNKTNKIAISRNYTSGELELIDSINRCENVTCQSDKQCQSGYCQHDICSLCNLYPLKQDKLCPGQICENNDQCSTNICYSEVCTSLNECNQTLQNIDTSTQNRCLNLSCSHSSDCQPFAQCSKNKCTLKSLKQSADSHHISKSTLIIILGVALSTLVGATLLFFIARYLYHKRLKSILIQNKVRKNNINLTTENSIVQQKENNSEELVSSVDKSAFQDINKTDTGGAQIEKKVLDPTKILQL